MRDGILLVSALFVPTLHVGTARHDESQIPPPPPMAARTCATNFGLFRESRPGSIGGMFPLLRQTPRVGDHRTRQTYVSSHCS
jgi:hypothetical protein